MKVAGTLVPATFGFHARMGDSMRGRARSLSALLLLAMLAGGCADDDGAKASPPSAPDPTDEVFALVLPFDSFELSLEETYQASAARDVLIRRCLRSKGDEWPEIKYPARAPDPKNRRRYGVIEMEVARKLGYHPAPGILGSRAVVDQRQKRDKEISAGVFRAVYDEKSGCGPRAEGHLQRNGGSADYDLFNRLSQELLAKAQREPEVQKAARAWSSCMASRGLEYDEPADALADKRWWAKDSDRPSPAEVDTAVADVQCQRRSKVIRFWYSAERRLQKEAVREHKTYFNSLMHAKKINLSNVREEMAR